MGKAKDDEVKTGQYRGSGEVDTSNSNSKSPSRSKSKQKESRTEKASSAVESEANTKLVGTGLDYPSFLTEATEQRRKPKGKRVPIISPRTRSKLLGKADVTGEKIRSPSSGLVPTSNEPLKRREGSIACAKSKGSDDGESLQPKSGVEKSAINKGDETPLRSNTSLGRVGDEKELELEDLMNPLEEASSNENVRGFTAKLKADEHLHNSVRSMDDDDDDKEGASSTTSARRARPAMMASGGTSFRNRRGSRCRLQRKDSSQSQTDENSEKSSSRANGGKRPSITPEEVAAASTVRKRVQQSRRRGSKRNSYKASDRKSGTEDTMAADALEASKSFERSPSDLSISMSRVQQSRRRGSKRNSYTASDRKSGTENTMAADALEASKSFEWSTSDLNMSMSELSIVSIPEDAIQDKLTFRSVTTGGSRANDVSCSNLSLLSEMSESEAATASASIIGQTSDEEGADKDIVSGREIIATTDDISSPSRSSKQRAGRSVGGSSARRKSSSPEKRRFTTLGSSSSPNGKGSPSKQGTAMTTAMRSDKSVTSALTRMKNMATTANSLGDSCSSGLQW